MKTNWNDLFKIKIANSDDSFQKHEVIKLLVVMKILKKYPKKHWIRIYTEFQLDKIKTDIYFEDIKKKEVICYEVQKECDEKYQTERIEKYQKIEIPFFNKIDLVIIPIKELSDNIIELNKQLDKYII